MDITYYVIPLFLAFALILGIRKNSYGLFIKGAKERGFVNIKGHRSVGGMRASIYNAMPYEGVEALVEYMKHIEAENI